MPQGAAPQVDPPQLPQKSRIPAVAALWVVPAAAAGLVLAAVGTGVGTALTGRSTSGLSDLLGEIGLWAAMLGTALLVARRFGTGRLSCDYGLAIKPFDLLWGLLALGVGLGISGLVVAVFSGTSLQGTNNQILTQQKSNHVGLVLVAVVVALGAPFFEELFFRGYLRTALRSRFGAHGAIWLQAGIFGLAHYGESSTALGNVSVVLAIFGLGVVLGYVAQLTGRLGAGMVAHSLFNLVAVASVL